MAKNAQPADLNGQRANGPIGFRLAKAQRQALLRRAAELGVSHHELARHYVLEALGEAEDRVLLREDLAVLQNEVNTLRADLALAVEALLVSAGKVPRAEARAWVQQNLPCSPCPTP